jgi:peptidoglycan LD-endopeptidase CwlK
MTPRCEKRLEGVNPRLVAVIRRAAQDSSIKFIVTEGLRTRDRQAQLVKAGASRTMNSKHLIGRAVDLAVVVDGEVRWDWPLYDRLGEVVKNAAKELDIPIVWGGDWKSFKDGPHFELSDTVMA